jgi:hypothetical protein
MGGVVAVVHEDPTPSGPGGPRGRGRGPLRQGRGAPGLSQVYVDLLKLFGTTDSVWLIYWTTTTR